MEAIAAVALVGILARDGIAGRPRVDVDVKRRIETGDLRQFGTDLAEQLDRSEIGRLMKRAHRHQRFQIVHDRVIEQDGRGEPGAAVQDAMADRAERIVDGIGLDDLEDALEHVLAHIVLEHEIQIGDLLAARLLDGKMRIGVQAVELAAQDQRELFAMHFVKPEFEAGRACVQRQNAAVHMSLSVNLRAVAGGGEVSPLGPSTARVFS